MPEYNYLIIGGGMTADSAVKGIREADATGTIGVIGTEPHPPYNRPPLSKSLWKGEPVDGIWRKTPTEHLDFHLSKTAVAIDRHRKTVTDSGGERYSYTKLLIATGGVVRRLPHDTEGIIYFRTLDDYQRLRKLTEQGERFAVIGGGFIGSEIAAALAMNGKSVVMIFPDSAPGVRLYPPGLSGYLAGIFTSKGVTLLANDSVHRIEQRSSEFIVTTTGGRTLTVHGVVAGIGIQPNSGLAQSAGLAVDNGVTVDEFLRTSDPDIYSAGDVANFYSIALEKRIRVEHEDNAIVMGECAGRNMAGEAKPYLHLPFFYSDIFEAGYEAVGELDARYEMVEEWKHPFREGVVYYLHAGRVRGVLLWNTWGQVDAARKLIAEPGPFSAEQLRSRVPA